MAKALIDFLLAGRSGVNNGSDFKSFTKKRLSLRGDFWLDRGERFSDFKRLGEACPLRGMVDASGNDKDGIVTACLRIFNSGASAFSGAESGDFSSNSIRIDCGFGRGDIGTLRNRGDRDDAETVLLMLVGAIDSVVVVVLTVVVVVVVMAGTGLSRPVVWAGTGGGASLGADIAGSGRRGELGGKDIKAPGSNERISLPESVSDRMNEWQYPQNRSVCFPEGCKLGW